MTSLDAQWSMLLSSHAVCRDKYTHKFSDLNWRMGCQLDNAEPTLIIIVIVYCNFDDDKCDA